MVPERDIRATGDTADPSVGVWFENHIRRNGCQFGGVPVCFDYFLQEGDNLGQGGGQ